MRHVIPMLLLAAAAHAVADDAKPDVRIRVVGTSDIHGYITQTTLASGQPVGGAATMAAYMAAVRAKDPDALLLDAGDSYQGTIVSNQGEGAAVTRYFNAVGYTANAVGNHEFDFGPVGPDAVAGPGQDSLGALKARMAESRFPFLSANTCSIDEDPCTNLANYKPASFARPYIMRTVRGVKVAVIGLTTPETPSSTMLQNVVRLRFLPLEAALDRYVPQVKAEGAQVVIVVAHAGARCKDGSCEGEMIKAIDMVKPETRSAIALVVGGHTHTYVNTVHKGVRVMLPGRYGQSFSYASIDVKANGAIEVAGQTVDFCQRVFADTRGCRGGAGELAAPVFEGVTIAPVASMAAAIAPDEAIAAKIAGAVVGKLSLPIAAAGPNSTVGHFVTDALLNCFDGPACKGGADIALMNRGGLRSDVPAGPVTYGQVFEVMPFDNTVATIELPGSAMRDLMALWADGQGSLPHMAGMTMRYQAKTTATRTITNGAGAVRTVPDQVLALGGIDDKKTYKIVLADFMATGGGLEFMMGALKPAPVITSRKVRDVIVDYLKAHPEGLKYDGQPPRVVEVR